jgi:hypothetical protein
VGSSVLSQDIPDRCPAYRVVLILMDASMSLSFRQSRLRSR